MKFKNYHIEVDKFNVTKLDLDRINKVIVHCSTEDFPHSVVDIHIWHMIRGWAGCGYHYFIRKSGIIEKGRPLYLIGAHCKGQNRTSFGVCLEGETEFTQKQGKAFLRLKNYFYDTYDFDISYFPHSDFNKKKTCPNVCVKALLKGKIKLIV